MSLPRSDRPGASFGYAHRCWPSAGLDFCGRTSYNAVHPKLEVRSELDRTASSVHKTLLAYWWEIGGAGYCRLEYYFLLYSAFTSPATSPGLSLSEVSASNAERMGKRPPGLAASKCLQISATSSSNLGDREVAGAQSGNRPAQKRGGAGRFGSLPLSSRRGWCVISSPS